MLCPRVSCTFLVFSCLCLLASMASAFQDCVVLLGDSLTQNQDVPGSFSARMNAAYARRLDVLNRGYGGYTSSMVIPLLDHIFAKKEIAEHLPRVRLVTVWLGTNDAVKPPVPRAVPLETFRQNIEQILTALTSPDSPYDVAAHPVSIVLITPSPLLSSQLAEHKKVQLSQDHTKLYRDALLEIAEQWKQKEQSTENKVGWKLEVLDFWKAIEQAAGGLGEELAPMYLDGVHLTTQGYSVLFDAFSDLIKTKFKGRGLDFTDFDDLPFRAPWWDKVDLSDISNVVKGMGQSEFR